MEPMLVAIFVLVVLVVGALAAAALRRWSEDEVHSVDHYRRSLDTLEVMQEGPSDHDEQEGPFDHDEQEGALDHHESGYESGFENARASGNGDGQDELSARSFRAGKPMVRPIDPNRPTPVTSPIAPFVSPPAVPRAYTVLPNGADDEAPVIRFDDLAPPTSTGPTTDDEAPVIRFDDLAHPTATPAGTDDDAPVIRFDDLAHPTPTATGSDDEPPVIRFDDLAHPTPTATGPATDDEPPPEPGQAQSEVGESHRSHRTRRRVRQAIDASNRQLGAPIAAIAAAALLIVVLVVTGLHSANAPHHTKNAAAAIARPVHRDHGSPPSRGSATTTAPTTTTTAPVVSAPNVSTSSSATYQVAAGNFTLALSASHGQCWIRVTDASGTVLFNGTLSGGQSQSVSATGPITIVAGAPSVFTATVNGSPVSLPSGALAPLTLKFVSAASTST